MTRTLAAVFILAVVAVGGVARAQSLTDDPAFALYRQAGQAAGSADTTCPSRTPRARRPSPRC